MAKRLFDEVLGGTPKIGDWIMTFEFYPAPFLIQSIKYDGNEYTYSLYSSCYVGNGEHLYQGHFDYFSNQENDNDIIVISSKLAHILYDIGIDILEKVRNRIYHVYHIEDTYLDRYTVLEILLDTVDCYLNNIVTPLTKYMYLITGIKRVVKRIKGSGIRIIELNNGQYWKVHREKFNRKRNGTHIARYNEKHAPIKSVKYNFIERVR